MYILVIIFLVGINLAPFFLQNVHIWNAHGFWTVTSISIIFFSSFFDNKKRVVVKNLPLGLLALWATLSTAFITYNYLTNDKFSVINFLPYFNLLIMIIFYQVVIQHLNRSRILLILEFMRYTMIVTLLLCTLQFFNLSQFFYLFKPNYSENNLMVGFLGNPTQLSSFIAAFTPLFFIRFNRENFLCLVLAFIILTQTGTTKGEPALTGFIVLFFVILYLLPRRIHKGIYILLCLSVAVGMYFLNLYPDHFFHEGGRLAIWKYYWDYLRTQQLGVFGFITGMGLGSINMIFPTSPYPKAAHLHIEYAHFLFELGLIGLVLIINLIKSFIEIKPEDKIEKCLKAIIIGFLISCFNNYPAHLWMPTAWTMFIYASLMCIKNERIIHGSSIS